MGTMIIHEDTACEQVMWEPRNLTSESDRLRLRFKCHPYKLDDWKEIT